MNEKPEDAEVKSPLWTLAFGVAADLTKAGFPAKVLQDPYEEHSGVALEVDTEEDAASGVYVRWECGPEMRSAAAAAVANGDLANSAIRVNGQVLGAMQGALNQILTALDYQVRDSEDDLRPYAVRVESGPDGE